MPKYYVSCGNFKLIISRQTPILAAMATIRFAMNKKQADLFFRPENIVGANIEPNLSAYPDLNEDVYVSEEGFSDEANNVAYFDTTFIMKEIMSEDFKNFGKKEK